jgi:hypothetical protein
MSTINSNIVDYFKKIEELTNTNLNILKAINESFITNRNNVSVTIGETTYTVPSCFSIENKVNSLQSTIEGFLNIPSTGEVCCNVDGNTRTLELKQYSYAPNSIDLYGDVINFDVNKNNIFKEILTPSPVINFNLDLPNDIFEVSVRKIIAKSNRAKQLFATKLDDKISHELSYAQIVSLISTLNASDYEIYDKTHKLNARTSKTGEGSYVIEDIISTYIDNDGYEIYELKIKENSEGLTYKKFDGLIVNPLVAGDFLRTTDGTGKVQIILVDNTKSILKVKLITNDAINLIPLSKSNNTINEHSSLHYFNGDSIFNKSGKYTTELKVSLEEDRYMFVCIAAINSRLNTQSEWGNGILIDTNKLTLTDGTTFSNYYNDNVKNLGDALFEMSASLTLPISSTNTDTYNTLIGIKPEITDELLRVVEINTHLKSKTYEDAITSLNTLNTKYENALNTIKSFENNVFTENDYQYRELQKAYDVKDACQNEYIKFFESTDTNNILSYEPKYRIRGFIKPLLPNLTDLTFVPDDYKLKNDNITINLVGMQVQYCYNDKSTLPESVSIYNDTENKTYIYPLWTDAPIQFRKKKLKFENNKISYIYENSTNSADIKFNQVDIPIKENESVKIRVKFIYDLGQPFNTITTDWSNTINVNFDNTILTHKNISSIIDQANDNMLNIKANNIIVTSGIKDHIKYSQTQTGFVHHASTVDSGFRTTEQNIISLEQKLREMSDSILDLQDAINDDLNDLQVSVTSGFCNIPLLRNDSNIINLESYNSFLKLNTEVGEGDTPTPMPMRTAARSINNDIGGVGNSDSLLDSSVDPDISNPSGSGSSGGSSGLGDSLTPDDNVDVEQTDKPLGNPDDNGTETPGDLNNGTTVPDDTDTDIPTIESDIKLLNFTSIRGNEYVFNDGVVSTIININIKNNGKQNIRLYSLFPGNRNIILNNSRAIYADLNDYCGGRNTNSGIWMMYEDADDVKRKRLQSQNQFITFRMNDVWDGTVYYSDDADVTSDNIQSSTDLGEVTKLYNNALLVCPYLSNKYSICLDSDNVKSYMTLKPGESIIIPMYCEYKVSKSLQTIKKTISFDLRTSLYSDPVNYSFIVVASNTTSPQARLSSTNRGNYWTRLLNKLNLN